MHGVVLLAVFAFTAAGVARGRRRAGRSLASLVLVAGAGWPSTIFPGHDDLGRGACCCSVVALALVARARGRPSRRAAPQVLVATALVVVALVASSSGRRREGAVPRLAELGPLDEAGHAGQRRVRVERPTTAASASRRSGRASSPCAARQRSVYWRATTLDTFVDDAWDEELLPTSAFGRPTGPRSPRGRPAAADERP